MCLSVRGESLKINRKTSMNFTNDHKTLMSSIYHPSLKYIFEISESIVPFGWTFAFPYLTTEVLRSFTSSPTIPTFTLIIVRPIFLIERSQYNTVKLLFVLGVLMWRIMTYQIQRDDVVL